MALETKFPLNSLLAALGEVDNVPEEWLHIVDAANLVLVQLQELEDLGIRSLHSINVKRDAVAAIVAVYTAMAIADLQEVHNLPRFCNRPTFWSQVAGIATTLLTDTNDDTRP